MFIYLIYFLVVVVAVVIAAAATAVVVVIVAASASASATVVVVLAIPIAAATVVVVYYKKSCLFYFSEACLGESMCCNSKNQCSFGEGDCASDHGCLGAMICGKNNCKVSTVHCLTILHRIRLPGMLNDI